MKAFRRTAALIGVVGLLVTACTSDPDEGAAGDTAEADGSAAGSTTGITDDTIRIGFIGADFGAPAQTGVVPDLGDQPKIVQAVVDEINEEGGIAGRQIDVRIELVDGLAGPEAAQAACLEMTQDFGAFAELACLVAGDARMLCLDEPTAGIAQREAEASGPLLLRVRPELDASMLVIEHDMPLVMSIRNRIYCLRRDRPVRAQEIP